MNIRGTCLAILLLSAAVPAGCAGRLSLRPAGGSPPVYYLFPGEPAPVEGPQMRTRDFETLLETIRELQSAAGKTD
ncbi:MAG: hypothetical protein JW909_06265 [Planctomycetes bacterium]|nr:hypothetical protein [Planctomycetota bacterium]